MNYHLVKDGSKLKVTNFSSDLRDGMVYAHVLHAIAPEVAASAASLASAEPLARAAEVRLAENA